MLLCVANNSKCATNFFSKMLLFFLLLRLFPSSANLQTTNVGLLYEATNPNMETLFQLAIKQANIDSGGEIQLHGVAASIDPGNAFDTSKKLCKMLKQNLVAIFGPATDMAAKHSMSICDAKELPFIDTRWDFGVQMQTVNLYPHATQLAAALKDLIVALEWTEGYTIIYETGEFLPMVNELLQMYDTAGPTITVRRYELDLNGDYRNVLRRIRNSDDYSFVVVGSIDTLPEFFKQAQQVGLMTGDYRYIVANLDFQTMDLEPFQHGDTNITSLRLVSPEDNNVLEVAMALYDTKEPFQNVSCPLTTNMALMYDGVQLLAETFKHVMFRAVPLNCNDDNSWDKGYTLVNYMKSLSINGLTGDIKFDYEGLRTDFALDVVELTVSGLQKIGEWKTDGGFIANRPPPTVSLEQDQRSLVNKSFVVITAISEPYGMLKDSPHKLEGNDQYEGFGIELIEKLGKKLGFSYTFRLQEDNKYGSFNATTGKWDGMLLEIMEGRADLGITDLTMTSIREEGVDFTIPFMNLGISILFRKPMKEPPKLFSFMSPFSGTVWMWLGIAYFSVSLTLFILGRISPGEWDNPYPCIEEPTELETQFSFPNCLWFSIGALLQQGSELAPKTYSTRAVAAFWWFFTLILVSSYTANLAAFLTVESLSTPIENAEDLAANKGGVKYGAKVGGSTFTFFQDAKYPTYQKMYEFMRDNPQYMTNSNADGVDRVENQNYAFLMESTTIEYITERRCSLTQVGSLLDEKGYGIAMRKNAPYRDLLSQAVLELQEQGVLTKMKTKWWKEKRGGGACLQDKDNDGAEELGMANMGGVYYVLLVGACVACLCGVLEWLCFVYATARRNKVSFKAELIEEFHFVMQCSGNTRPVKYPKNSSRSRTHSSNSSSSSSSSMSVDSLPTDRLDDSKLHHISEHNNINSNHKHIK